MASCLLLIVWVRQTPAYERASLVSTQLVQCLFHCVIHSQTLGDRQPAAGTVRVGLPVALCMFVKNGWQATGQVGRQLG